MLVVWQHQAIAWTLTAPNMFNAINLRVILHKMLMNLICNKGSDIILLNLLPNNPGGDELKIIMILRPYLVMVCDNSI